MFADTSSLTEKLDNALAGCQLKLASKLTKREKQKEASDKLTLDYQERIRRVRMLEDLERNMEGFYNSVKIVMKEAQKDLCKVFMDLFQGLLMFRHNTQWLLKQRWAIQCSIL